MSNDETAKLEIATMTLCVVTKGHCLCQPDEGVFCPDYKPDAYVQYLMDAIKELRTVRPEGEAFLALRNLMKESAAMLALCEPEMRDAAGNTNVAVLIKRIGEAAEILGRRGPQNGSPK